MSEKKQEKFTQSQEFALKDLTDFMNVPIKENDNNTRVYVLTGKAGTGKTFLIGHVFKELLEKDRASVSSDTSVVDDPFNVPRVIGVTMSHKAKNVLRGSIHVVKTFASYYGLKMKYDDVGDIYFEKNPKDQKIYPCDIAIDVLVLDEVSMFDMKMVNQVLKYTNPSTKIIMMGDPGQLPPVKSEGDMDSPSFSLFKRGCELKERVRQTKGNPIVELSDIIYNQTFGDKNLEVVYKAFKEDKIIDGLGFKSVFYSDFLSVYENSSKHFMDSKVIAYRNDKVKIFNKVSRDRIHDKPISDFIPGEIIYLNDTFFQQKSNNNPAYMLHNSDEYRINSVKKSVISGVEVDLIFIDKSGHNHISHIKDPFIPVVTVNGRKKYEKILYYRKKEALQAPSRWEAASKWTYYYDFKNQFGDVSYGYCYTAYKAQGSTFKNVFVDVNDIVTVGPLSNKRKLQALYTAVTRASHNLTLLKTK